MLSWIFSVWLGFFSLLSEISETITCQHCHGEHFRTLTLHIRKWRIRTKLSVYLCLFYVVSHALYFLSRLLLSGNPLDCVCENLWIKLRLQEETDSPELTCTDDRGVAQDFATFRPPDCGKVKASHNKQIWVDWLISNVWMSGCTVRDWKKDRKKV